MNIVFLVSSLGPGGAERVATTLCNEWSARGDQVTLVPTFSGGGKPFYEVSNNVEIIYLADLVSSGSKSPWNYVRRFFALRNLIRTKKPDVVISFLANVNVAAILTTSLLVAPVICCERRNPSSQPVSLFWEFACRMTYRFTDMLVVQTESVENTIGRLYPHLKRVRTVANPLPDGVILIKKEDVARARKILLSLGRLSDEKQVDKIITAFTKISSDYPDWDLRIYGDGPMRAQLDNLIQSIGIQNRVFIMGRTITPWIVMAEADAFVMTSKYEGFPNALLEAMGVGLPCVVFDCPSGPKEITRDGQDAFLVPFDDESILEIKLRELMGNDALRIQMGKQARDNVVARYSTPSVVAKWDSLFREIGAR
jgi:GalNAc-alpha-(1->4)-GalNAc-alpha-(1->3)-diNAcBac-PP-undecaprenol alpha-1,4-N-acetyl-D-galactosaminyltransferase